MRPLILIIIFASSVLSSALIGQNAPFESPYDSPVFLKQKAKGAERENDYLLAMSYYDKLKNMRPDNEFFWERHAYYSLVNKDYANAEKSYEHLKEQGRSDFDVIFYLARTKKHLSKYNEAVELLEKLKKDMRKTKEYGEVRKLLSAELEGCFLAQRMERVENAYTVKPLNRSVNSRQFEGSPVWINEDQFIYASHKNLELTLFDKDSNTEIPERAMFSAKRKGAGNWDSPKKSYQAPYIKSDGNFGNAAFNATRDKFFFTLCEKNDQFKIECKMYWSLLENGSWSTPQLIPGEVNMDGYSSTQPTMGYETMRGREVLYFVSDRPGGKGGMDIWYAILSDRKNRFVSVSNAGSRINTAGNEMTPHYTLPDSILYFSSDGHPGMGGLDIFQTKGERVMWDEPTNIGIPFNSPQDDLYFQPKKGKKEGLLVSNRVGSTPLYGATCCDDIFYYKFEKPVELFAEIQLMDEKSGVCLNGEELQMFVHDKYTDDKFLINQFKQSDCLVRVALNPDLKYSFEGNLPNYLSDELVIETVDIEESKVFRDTVYVRPGTEEEKAAVAAESGAIRRTKKEKEEIQTSGKDGPITKFASEEVFGGLNRAFNEPVVLKDIYYEFDSHRLTPKAIASIEEFLIPFLEAFPDIIVSLDAHTDHIGPELYNLELSQKRAARVAGYLISRGIDPKRIIPRGYGESRPVAPNLKPDGSDNPEGRALNRRTELRVVGHLLE